MSWEKILTHGNLSSGTTAGGILSDGTNVLSNASWNGNLISDGDAVALGFKRVNGVAQWSLISDLGDASTSSTLDDLESSLGAYIDGTSTWVAPTGTNYINTATDMSDAISKLDTQVKAATDAAAAGGFDAPGGTLANDMMVWNLDPAGDGSLPAGYVVESRANFLNGMMADDATLSALSTEVDGSLNNSGTYVYTYNQSSNTWSETDTTNWDNAVSWGDHALEGYLTSETFTSLVQDGSPQLGGQLDANGQSIDMGTNTITDAKVGNWDTAYGWDNHANYNYADATQVGTDIATAVDAITGVPSQTFTIQDGATADGDKIKLVAAGSSKLEVKTAGNATATLSVNDLELTGSTPIVFDGEAIVGGEFASVNTGFDFNADGGYSGLIALTNGMGLQVKRDHGDTGGSDIIDGAKLAWKEQDAQSTGKHGSWTASIIYSDPNATQEYEYQAPLSTVLQAGHMNFPENQTSTNPNGDANAGLGGDLTGVQVHLASSADVGSFYIGSDDSVWIKTS